MNYEQRKRTLEYSKDLVGMNVGEAFQKASRDGFILRILKVNEAGVPHILTLCHTRINIAISVPFPITLNKDDEIEQNWYFRAQKEGVIKEVMDIF